MYKIARMQFVLCLELQTTPSLWLSCTERFFLQALRVLTGYVALIARSYGKHSWHCHAALIEPWRQQLTQRSVVEEMFLCHY